jgi:hypothetical protein
MMRQMRDALIFGLLVSVCVLGWMLHVQSGVVADQQRQIRELGSKMEEKSKAGSLDLQAACSKQARLEYDENGWRKEQLASFTNHYNEKMHKCFMLVESTTAAQPRDGTYFRNMTLSDAFEGRVYGQFDWKSDKVKKYWEVKPFDCRVMLPSGEETACQSADEFREAVKAFMQ